MLRRSTSDDMAGALQATIRNNRSELARVSRLIEAFGEAHALSPDLIFKVNLALDEVITNIVLHAYDDRTSTASGFASISRTMRLLSRWRMTAGPSIRFRYPFRSRPQRRDHVGGLGVHIVRSIMDGVEYRRDGDPNRLLMRIKVMSDES